jgi:hypothetical protein
MFYIKNTVLQKWFFPTLGNGKPWCKQPIIKSYFQSPVFTTFGFVFSIFFFFYIRSGVSSLTTGVNPYFTFEKEKYTLGTGVSNSKSK